MRLLARFVPMLFLAGCRMPISTGDARIDAVVYREAPWTDCVKVAAGPIIYLQTSKDGPPGLLTANSFKSEFVQTAARRIAIPYADTTEKADIRIFGVSHNGECPMRVIGPEMSGDLAFLQYSPHFPDGNGKIW